MFSFFKKNIFVLYWLSLAGSSFGIYSLEPADESVLEQINLEPVKNKPVIIHAHGLTDTALSFKLLLEKKKMFPGAFLYGNDGPEYADGYSDKDKICFGQEGDMYQLIAACEEAIANHGSPDIIGFGFSKGSATWLNVLGYLSESAEKNSSHKKILSCIKAVVLVAPFADLFEVEGLTGLLGSFGPIAQRFAFTDYLGVGRKAIGRLLKSVFPGYNPHGTHPIKSAEKIKNDIPIFMAHSLGDEVIPIKHSRMLYAALNKQVERKDLKNTYLFEFDGGRHSKSMNACLAWHQPMYDFLVKYNLFSREDFVRGVVDLSDMQPSRSLVESKILKGAKLPSLAYGLFAAILIESYRYLKHKSNSGSGDYHTSWKNSCLYGLGIATVSECLAACRKP